MRHTGRIRTTVGIGLVVAAVIAGTLTLATATESGAADPHLGHLRRTAPDAAQLHLPVHESRTSSASTTLEQFQYLMYRPLLLVRQRRHAQPQPLALAGPEPDLLHQQPRPSPSTSNHYKWSNGETVTAENVMFWMNMLHAEKANWAGYSPGALPDDVQSITVNSPTQLTFTLTGPVNTYWFTYNELSQITPMPNAWDITAKGGAPNSGGCAGGRLRHGRQPVQGRLHLPVQAGRLRPEQPQGGQQLAVHLRHQPDLAGGRRTVEADAASTPAAT